MGKLELHRIPASLDNAHRLLEILNDDFGRLSLSDDELKQIADPDDKIRVAEIHDNLRKGPGEYFSVDRSCRWLGVVKLADWLYGDEAPFVSYTDTFIAKGLHRLGIRNNDAVGLHILARSAEVPDDEYDDVTVEMLASAVEQARKMGRATLKCAVDDEDSALRAAFLERSQYRHVLPISQGGIVSVRGIKRPSTLYTIAVD